MTTHELCKNIRRNIVNRAAEVMNYTNWGADFAAKQLTELPEIIINSEGFLPVQPADLTITEMDDLGFGVWEEENPMRLIPLWLFPFLAEEINCESISGAKSILKKSEMDNDHRMGFLAYGVLPKSEVTCG